MVRLVTVVVFIVFFLSIAQTTVIFFETSSIAYAPRVQAKAADGYMSMCINHLPELNTSCPGFMNQSTSIENNTVICDIGAYDPDGTAVNYTLIGPNGSSYGFVWEPFNDTYIRLEGNQTSIGLWTYNLSVSEINNSCAIQYIKNFTRNIWIQDVNDPPHLRSNIPSKRLSSGTALSAFYLRDYFGDVDAGDILTYNVTSPGYNITINSENSRVFIYSPAGFCGTDYAYFTATDDGGLSTDSNMVGIESICFIETPIGSSSSGGGGSRTCTPEWLCERWSFCLPNSTRYRRCIDINGCDPAEIEKIFWEPCIYNNATIEDEKDETPPVEEVPTCFDGIKNQGEIGIDCGGPCNACPQIEVPSLIPTEENNIVSVLIILISIFAAIMLAYIVFRREINKMLAKLGWWLTRKQKKQILLTDVEKNDLLQQISVLEHEVSIRKSIPYFKSEGDLVQEALRLVRQYMKTALKIRPEFTPPELESSVAKVVLLESLRQVFRLLMKRQLLLETSKINLSRIHLATIIEELRQLVLNTSRVTKQDYTFTTKEIPITGDNLEKLGRLLYNAMNALQFKEITFAQDRYFRTLELYESLEEEKKAIVYDDISRLYNEIRYVISWHK